MYSLLSILTVIAVTILIFEGNAVSSSVAQRAGIAPGSPTLINKGNITNSGATNTIATAKLSQSTSTSSSSSITTSAHNTIGHNGPKSLSVSIQSSQNIVNGKGRSNITAIAYDATSGKKVDNASVKLKITFGSNGTSKEIIGNNGRAIYSAEITPKNNSNNNYNATVEASAPGYISTTKTTTHSSTSTSITTG